MMNRKALGSNNREPRCGCDGVLRYCGGLAGTCRGHRGELQRPVTLFAGICMLLAASVARGADYYWTGGAGDHLWSSPANWSATSGGANLGPGQGPQDSASKSYSFPGIAEDLVVTQDINVVVSAFGASSAGNDEVRLKLVSADGCKMKFVGAPTLWLQKNICLELNVDMSSDTETVVQEFRSTEGAMTSRIVFNLKAPNSGARTLVLYDANRVDVAEGSAPPNLAIKVGSEDLSRDPDIVVFESGILGRTELRDLVLERNFTDNPSVRDKRYRVNAVGGDLVINSRSGMATPTNDLSGAVFSVAETLSLSFPKARPSVLHTLPNAKALSVDRTTTTIQARTAHVRLLFDDMADVLKDAVGGGGVIFDPSVSDANRAMIVQDPTRGSVVRFGGGSHDGFCGAGSNHSLPGFAPGETGFTVAFWIKPDADCGKLAKLLNFGTFANQQCVMIRLHDGTGDGPGKYLMFSNYGNNQYVGDSDLRGTWHHLALTYAAGKSGNYYERMYIDGVMVKELNWERNLNPNNFWIGQIWSGWTTIGDNPYKGLMDDFVLVDYPMTAREISELKEKGLAAFMPVAEVAASTTGCVAFDYAAPAVAGLAGDSIAAAVKVGVEGSTLTVGSEARKAQTAYAGAITGEDTTLVKVGAGYDLALSGEADAVTNVVVKEGTLTLNRATSVPGVIVRYDFDEGCVETGTGYAPVSLERRVRVSGNGTISSVADRNGESGKAIQFPGGQILATTANTGDTALPLGNDSYSVSVWIKPTDSYNRPVFSMGRDAENELSLLRFNDSGATCSGLTFTTYGTQVDVNGLSLGDGKWHHVVAAYDGVTGRKALYVDGVKTEQTGSRTLNLASSPLYIGYRTYNDRGYLGDMDEFIVFDHALTDSEVENLRTGTLEPPSSVLTAEPDVEVASGATLRVSSDETVNFLSGTGAVVVEAGGRLVVRNGKGFKGTVSGSGRFKDLSKKGLLLIVK